LCPGSEKSKKFPKSTKPFPILFLLTIGGGSEGGPPEEGGEGGRELAGEFLEGEEGGGISREVKGLDGG
jgi:hypothetical protein